MYRIPESFDPKSLEQSLVIQISFSINSITIFFGDVGYMTIEGSFSFEVNGQRNEYENIFPIRNDFGLLNLLEKKLVQVDITQERTGLKLEFEDNMVIYLIGRDEYENFRINIQGEKIIV